MSETNTYMIKQVWRQKGDALFEEIPFKEENKATELSQTTSPVLLLETKTGGGSGAVFAIGRVKEQVVIEKAVEYPNGEFLYHVPFSYELILDDKKAGLSREELQELAGQKFAPQAKGGLYAIEESVYLQVEALLKERQAGQAASASVAEETPAVKAETKAPKAKAASKSTAKKAPSQGSDNLTSLLQSAQQSLLAQPELRLVIEEGNVSYYPAVLLESTTDMVALQQTITEYVSAGDKAGLDVAAQEVAAASATTAAPRFAKIIGLVERLVREDKYDSVQVPTAQKAFYRESKLPNPYQAIELKGATGHHVLGTDGTLYSVEGKTIQHFLGL
ncbi:MAG: hypothetical protein ACXVOI_02700 [Tumebacillaceae bacterium]